MKKILLATSILAGTAAFASAEVTLSGDARFGIQSTGAANAVIAAPGVAGQLATTASTTLEKRMTINIDGKFESESGIVAGGRIRLRSDEVAGTGISGARVFVTAGGLTVAAGNINGAIESMPGLYSASVGLTGLNYLGVVTNVTGNDWGWDSFSSRGNGAEGLEVIYSAGALGVHLSHSDGLQNGFSGTYNGANAAANLRRTAVHVSYAFGDWTVALGGQVGASNTNTAANTPGVSNTTSQNKVVLTVGGKVGNFNVAFAAADNNTVKKYALSGSTTFGATSVSAFVAKEDLVTNALWGLGVSHDLGGVSLVGGVANGRNGGVNVDAGVSFSF